MSYTKGTKDEESENHRSPSQGRREGRDRGRKETRAGGNPGAKDVPGTGSL